MSAIVVTSSGFAMRPFSGILSYSCSKTFASFLAQGLSYEFAGKIDCLAWECGETKTKMIGQRQSLMMVDTANAVKGVLADLGRTNLTNGTLKHEFAMSILNKVPL